jgi:hypothetical protein
MATTKRKPETAAEKARRLRFFVDGGTPLPPKDAAWLKAYEPAEVKRQARKTKAGDARLKQAETKAKKTGRSLTVADLREAAKPAQPVSRRKLRPEEEQKALDVAARLDVALMENQVESLAMAKALAFACLPRVRTSKRQVSKATRTGRGDWIAVTYTATVPGLDLIHGADLLAIMAITDRLVRHGNRRMEFDNLTGLVETLEGGTEEGKRWGAKSKALAVERLKRASGTSITVTFYRNEAQARAMAGDHYRMVQFGLVRDYYVPDQALEELGAVPLWGPYLEVSEDFAQHVTGDSSHLMWYPVEIVKALAPYPLRLALFALIYPRAFASQSFWEMPFEELVDLLNETERRDRDVMRDVRDALDHIHKLTGSRLQVHLVESAEKRTGGRGRPQKRWALRFGPSKPLTRRAKGELKESAE